MLSVASMCDVCSVLLVCFFFFFPVGFPMKRAMVVVEAAAKNNSSGDIVQVP